MGGAGEGERRERARHTKAKGERRERERSSEEDEGEITNSSSIILIKRNERPSTTLEPPRLLSDSDSSASSLSRSTPDTYTHSLQRSLVLSSHTPRRDQPRLLAFIALDGHSTQLSSRDHLLKSSTKESSILAFPFSSFAYL